MAGFIEMVALMGALATTPAPESVAVDEAYACGMLPPSFANNQGYTGWSSCAMKESGAAILWKGLPEGQSKVTRFIFTQGHGLFYRTVTISEFVDGRVTMEVAGTRRRDSLHAAERQTANRIPLSKEDAIRIAQLGEQSGAWAFAVGTWDKTDDIFMDCQLLEMERADGSGYKYSSVNIGCNKPAKLMPLVDEIARLAKLKTAYDGKLYY